MGKEEVSNRFRIMMDLDVTLDEDGFFGGVDFPTVLDALDGVEVSTLLDDWNLESDLVVEVMDLETGDRYDLVHGAVWRKR